MLISRGPKTDQSDPKAPEIIQNGVIWWFLTRNPIKCQFSVKPRPKSPISNRARLQSRLWEVVRVWWKCPILTINKFSKRGPEPSKNPQNPHSRCQKLIKMGEWKFCSLFDSFSEEVDAWESKTLDSDWSRAQRSLNELWSTADASEGSHYTQNL